MPPMELFSSEPNTIAIPSMQPPPLASPVISFLLREAAPADSPRILRLARMLDSINLPTEEADLAALITRSTVSFRGAWEKPEDGVYLFVLEEAVSHDIVGTAMIIAKHGTPESPHFYLEMATDQRYSKTLKKMFRHTYLTLRRCIDGPTEVGGLIVDPTYRQHPAKIGKQLSFVRFLYIAMYPDRFEEEVLAEMMPPLTKERESLFWECYGKRVTGLNFREADKLSMKDKEFIDALFPSIPLYVCMFPIEVQEQLGVVGPDSQGAVHLLEKIGLRFLRHVDPFDGGPFYGAKVKDLVLVQQFRRCRVRADTVEQEVEKGEDLLIGWESADGFRAARVRARSDSSRLVCSAGILSALELAEGTEVGVIPFI
ncbi:MAG TPA: arginine N-succinyltransferase [Methylomirabilota bacterium]|nr:arginine N-succinyltransferase [Methylomirabilota bacterium]